MDHVNTLQTELTHKNRFREKSTINIRLVIPVVFIIN